VVAAGELEGTALGETVPALQALVTRARRMAAGRIKFIRDLVFIT
jgi:hypothetical protein